MDRMDSNARTESDAVVVGVVNPLQGPLGIIGPSAQLCAELAAEEINRDGGILGREVKLVHIDGGAQVHEVRAEVLELAMAGRIQAVAGVHTSTVREALASAIGGAIPYIYNSLYEGGERRPGVFVTGETPETQLLPAMTLLAGERRISRWALVGNDYVWPRGTASAIREHLATTGSGILVDEMYVPLGTSDFGAHLDRLERSTATAVVVLLVGQDAVEFHRQYAERELDAKAVRLTPLMDENMLLAAGDHSCRGLYVGAGYFSSLCTSDSLDFVGRYARRFGADAPLVGTMGESCYEGLHLLAALARTAGTLDLNLVNTLSNSLVYECARGVQRLDAGHTALRTYLAEADGFDFNVLTEMTPVALG